MAVTLKNPVNKELVEKESFNLLTKKFTEPVRGVLSKKLPL
jgi:hypothetical protein